MECEEVLERFNAELGRLEVQVTRIDTFSESIHDMQTGMKVHLAHHEKIDGDIKDVRECLYGPDGMKLVLTRLKDICDARRKEHERQANVNITLTPKRFIFDTLRTVITACVIAVVFWLVSFGKIP